MKKTIAFIMVIVMALGIAQMALALTLSGSHFTSIEGIQLGMSYEQVRQRTQGIVNSRIYQNNLSGNWNITIETEAGYCLWGEPVEIYFSCSETGGLQWIEYRFARNASDNVYNRVTSMYPLDEAVPLGKERASYGDDYDLRWVPKVYGLGAGVFAPDRAWIYLEANSSNVWLSYHIE